MGTLFYWEEEFQWKKIKNDPKKTKGMNKFWKTKKRKIKKGWKNDFIIVTKMMERTSVGQDVQFWKFSKNKSRDLLFSWDTKNWKNEKKSIVS